MLKFSLLLFLLLSPRLQALSLATGTDYLGNACDIVSWSDAAGSTRTVWIKKSSPGGFITRYTWYSGATLIDSRLRENYPPWGFLVLVNHWHPDTTGNFVASCNAPDLTVPLAASVPFQGPHHLVWRGTFRMRMDPTAAVPTSWYNTVEFLFADGRNDFVFACAYDSSDMPQSGLWSDLRGPYGEIDWDGDGSSLETISGLGWGSRYKFRTTSAPLTQSSAWDYTQANTIPYTWQWKNGGLGDSELGIVQNQPYAVQSASAELHVGACSSFPAPPSTGSGMPTNVGCVAYQMNSYGVGGTLYKGQRFAWGTVWRNAWGLFLNGKGVFEEGHSDAFNTYTYSNQYPVNAWSWNILVGRHSDNGTPNLVDDTERAYGCTLTASVGSVVTAGPRGPGNYVAPATGGMPVIPYSKAGFDFVYRAWTLQASAGAVQAGLQVPGGGLKRPSFIIKGMAAAPCQIRLNGVAQVEGVDLFSSLDAGGSRLFFTFNKDLAAGAHAIEVLPSCGSPTHSPTRSPTPTRSPAYTHTASPTATPTPGPCAANANPLLLGPGKKIVFMGDSITFRGNYSRQVEAYLKARYPSYNLAFVNTGVGGWTAANAVADSTYGLNHVLSLNPDIVTVCYGMNDAGFAPFDPSRLTAYQNAVSSIVSALKGAGKQVVLLGPGIVDRSVPWASNPSNVPADYNSTLDAYADWIMAYAAAQNVPAFHVNSLALSLDAAAKAGHPGTPYYTDIPQDGVHPNPSGGLPYVYGVLSALGVPYDCRSLDLNVGAGTINASAGLAAGPLSSGPAGISFSLTLDRLPYVGNLQAAKALPFLSFQQKFNKISFSVSGLAAPSYYVIIDGYRAGLVTSAALAGGINLMDHWIKPSGSVSEIHNIELRDASLYGGPACYDALIDDMEDSNAFPPTPNNVKWPSNHWGGLWYGGSGNGGPSTSSPSPFVMSGAGYNSPLSAQLAGTTNLSTNLQLLLCYVYTQYDDPKDGVRFMFKGNAGQPFRLQVHTEPQDLQVPVNYADYGYTFTATGAWQLVSIPFSSMAQPSWASGADLFTLSPGQITTLLWLPYFSGSFDMSVDDLHFTCSAGPATPTPTRTPCAACSTPSMTRTRSATPSSTSTATAASSATRSRTLTLTSSPTVTASPSGTLSWTPTLSRTQSPSPTLTRTPLPSGTLTGTPTASRTLTGTPTLTRTGTSTLSLTGSVTRSGTSSVTPSHTLSPAMTSTPSFTKTLSSTETANASPTRSLTATPSRTLSKTPSLSGTPTGTPTASPTPSATDAFSPTASPAQSAVASFTRSRTLSLTRSSTATHSATPTRSASPTRTSTSSPSLTQTPLSTFSQTASPSPTASETAMIPATLAPSATFTPTGTLPVPTQPALGPLEIVLVLASPNPNPRGFHIKVLGASDRCGVEIFSTAMQKLASLEGPGAAGAGWVALHGLPELANGTYYARAWARRGELASLKALSKFTVLK